MNKKLLWTIIILIILLGALWGLMAAGVIGKDEGIKVSAEKAQVRTIIESVNASGKIYPEVEVKISPDISGEVVALNVNEGDTVKKGQELAKIYADIYVTQRDQVAAIVTQAQAQLANLQASLVGLKATVDQTEANYKRQKKLLDDKVISRQEFETAEQAYRSAEANYNAAIQNINANKANIKNAQAQLAKANEDLSRTIITAPISGVVSLLSIKKGERVAGNSFNVGTEMMRIADLSSIVAQVDVGENDIPKIKIGDTALVEVDAYNDRKFKGVVYKIANPATNASATTTTTSTDVTNYKVHIRLLPESYQDLIVKGRFPFRPGMSASADIQTRTAPNVLSVPLNAVTTRDMNADSTANAAGNKDMQKAGNSDSTQEVVFVIQKDGTVKMTPVKTGIQDLNYIQVTSGLQAGDEVVTGPYSTVSKLLKNKDKVLVTPKDKLYEVKPSN
jgi:HlyD family secretion protein